MMNHLDLTRMKANACLKNGEAATAYSMFHSLATLYPRDAGIRSDLGVSLEARGMAAEAERAYRDALAMEPNHPQALNNLITLLAAQRRPHEAEAHAEALLKIRPGDPNAKRLLAQVRRETGRMPECVKLLDDVARQTNAPADGSDRLFHAIHLDGDHGAAHQQWGKRWEPHTPPGNTYDGSRPLRIGYLSPNLRRHTVPRFLAPVLAAHDADVFVYCDNDADHVTRELAAHGAWRHVKRASDLELYQAIRRDRLDVLVDLTGHLNRGRRQGVIAGRPAPLMVSYIGYPLGTGHAWQYRVTDGVMDPADTGEPLIRLSTAYAFAPAPHAGAVSACPSLTTGLVTFGSLNRSCKITPAMAAAWGRILRRVPGSRLIVQCDGGERTAGVRAYLEQHVDGERFTLAPHCPPEAFTALIDSIDVHLDTAPYSGMTTTCDVLWQGVPTITLAGQQPHSRVSASLLTACGLDTLVTSSLQAYEDRAVSLAADERLRAALRGTMRQRMAPILDGRPVALAMEAEFRRLLAELPRAAADEQPIDSEPAKLTIGAVAHGAAGVARALTGTGGADREMIGARTAICGGCDQARVVKGVLRQCKLCGCSTWAKIRNRNERCPLGRW